MASLFRRKSGIYYISSYEDGKRVWKSTGEKLRKAALKKLHDFERSPEPKKPRTNFERFASDFLAHREGKFAPATIALCERSLRLFQSLRGNVLLEKISSRDIDLYISHRIKTVSPVTVNIEIKTLRASFNTAIRWKLIEVNPMKEISMLRIPERDPIFLTREDFDRPLSTIEDEWFRRVVVVAVSTGMRNIIMANLRAQIFSDRRNSEVS